MKLPDTNVWLAAALSGHHFHAAARDWLNGEKSVGSLFFCRSTQQSFVRLLTTAAILRPFGNPPLTNREARGIYQGFLADPRIAFAQEAGALETIWQRLAARDTASPKIWMDTYLAAFAISGEYQLVTIDSDFHQYHGLDILLLARR